MKIDQEEVRQKLKSQDWKQYHSLNKEIWCKRWPDAPRCACNDDKEGIQVVITFHEPMGYFAESYEMDVTGQMKDGYWFKLTSYAIGPDNVMDAIETEPKKLVKAWSFLCESVSED